MEKAVNVVLHVVGGPVTGKRIEVPAGRTLTVGRNAKSQIAMGEDGYLSGIHFSVVSDGTTCLLRDEQSANGTNVNGRRVSETTLQHGDSIEAGQSKFLVEMIAAPYRNPSTVGAGIPAAGQLQQEVASRIIAACGTGRLYVLTHPSGMGMVALLAQWNVKALYEVRNGYQESYLAQVEETFEQLPSLVQAAWGKKAAVFLTSDAPYETVFKHLQAIGMARAANGNSIRFRFHHPWLLQVFLDSCSHEELKQFFGPIRAFLCEDLSRSGNVLEYSLGPAGLRRSVLRIGTEMVLAAGMR